MLFFPGVICIFIGSVLCKKEHFLKRFHAPSNLGISSWGKLTSPEYFSLHDCVLLLVLVFVVEFEKQNLDHEARVALYLDVFSCANICIQLYSL